MNKHYEPCGYCGTSLNPDDMCTRCWNKLQGNNVTHETQYKEQRNIPLPYFIATIVICGIWITINTIMLLT